MAHRRQQIERQQAGAARVAQQRIVVAEQAHQRVGEADGAAPVEDPMARLREQMGLPLIGRVRMTSDRPTSPAARSSAAMGMGSMAPPSMSGCWPRRGRGVNGGNAEDASTASMSSRLLGSSLASMTST